MSHIASLGQKNARLRLWEPCVSAIPLDQAMNSNSRSLFLKSCTWISVLSLPVIGLADKVDDYVRAEMLWQKIPGLSIAVCKNGKVIKAQGYGYSNLETHAPAKASTPYKIGSISKQFLAAGVLVLVQKKKISLDDSIRKHLLRAPEAWSGITIRNLLNHTSGLVREIPGADPSKQTPNAKIVEELYNVPLRFAPGQKWEYSNMGYFVLAEVIQKASGQPWNDFIQKEVFTPIRMSNTHEATRKGALKQSKGYDTRNGQIQSAEIWPALRPSGAFVSTVLDFAKWDAALNGNSLLNQASREQMWIPAKLASGQTKAYGFGWFLDPWNGHRRVYHSGGVPGFVAEFQRFTDEGISVIVMANIGNRDLSDIAVRVAGFYKMDLAEPTRKAIADANPAFTVKVRQLLLSLAKGEFDRSFFTLEAEKGVIGDIANGFPQSLREQGNLRNIELLESKPEGNNHVYMYRAMYKHLTLYVTLALNEESRIKRWSMAD